MLSKTVEFGVENFYVIGAGFFALWSWAFYFVLRARTMESRTFLLRLPFFQIRDRLRFQVSQGILQEDSEIYQHYDRLLNSLLRNAERLTIGNIAAAITNHGKELTESRIESRRIIRMVEKSHPEIQQTIRELYYQISELLVKQSRIAFLIGSLLVFVLESTVKISPSSADSVFSSVIMRSKYRSEAKHLGDKLAMRPC